MSLGVTVFLGGLETIWSILDYLQEIGMILLFSLEIPDNFTSFLQIFNIFNIGYYQQIPLLSDFVKIINSYDDQQANQIPIKFM